jgi:hypothetical protein
MGSVAVKGKRKRKRRPLGRRTSRTLAAVGLVAGGLAGGVLAATGPAGQLQVTSEGPASCVIFRAVP